jgi:hypothetical protein
MHESFIGCDEAARGFDQAIHRHRGAGRLRFERIVANRRLFALLVTAPIRGSRVLGHRRGGADQPTKLLPPVPATPESWAELAPLLGNNPHLVPAIAPVFRGSSCPPDGVHAYALRSPPVSKLG